MKYIVTIAGDAASIPSIGATGGKGASLCKCKRNGLDVPDGFIVTTAGYKMFIESANLVDAIESVNESNAVSIREKILSADLPSELSDEVRQAYKELSEDMKLPVAVRSSATAEDLPNLSFAGQQDTYLNVIGVEDVLTSIKKCFASLFTDRAVVYRESHSEELKIISGDSQLALAVVVQTMIPSESSGVLFTANPLTGHRAEMSIDATNGLGEQLVSGKVIPDHYIVKYDMSNRMARISDRDIHVGKRQVEKVADGDTGGTQLEEIDLKDSSGVLSDEHVYALVKMGMDVLDVMEGEPQDIEWAIVPWTSDSDQDQDQDKAKFKVLLLQSRPITSLFPIPAKYCRPYNAPYDPTDPPQLLWNWGTKQGMLEPLTPFGCDLLRSISVTVWNRWFAKATPDSPHYDVDTIPLWSETTGRLFLSYSLFFNNTILKKIFVKLASQQDEEIGRVTQNMSMDRNLFPKEKRTGAMQLLKMAFPFIMKLRAANKEVKADPVAARHKYVKSEDEDYKYILGEMDKIDKEIEKSFENAGAGAGVDGDENEHGNELKAQIDAYNSRLKIIDRCFGPNSWFIENILFIGGILMNGNGALVDLAKIASNSKSPELVMAQVEAQGVLQGGALHNPTTEMDLDLWETAREIKKILKRRDELSLFDKSLDELDALYKSRELPSEIISAIDTMLERYGFRAFSEIDIGRPRWRDEPIRMISTLKGLVKLDVDEDYDEDVDAESGKHPPPDIKFKLQGKAADELAERIAQNAPFWKRKGIRKKYKMGKDLVGLRDSPKFHLMRSYDLIRTALCKNADFLVELGYLTSRDRIFFLRQSEIIGIGKELESSQSASHYKSLADNRFLQYQLEMKRKQVPFMLITDGRVYYDVHSMTEFGAGRASASQKSENVMTATAVSPGIVEGRANVVFDPVHAEIEDGDIMITRGTDPSWTVLFMSIKGLVMETGGIFTHGSIVAREYGIPAVVGVGGATQRIKTGQRIRLDAIAGSVTILEEESEGED